MKPRRQVWRLLVRLYHDGLCLTRHKPLWKFDGHGANANRWSCRVCGRLWGYEWGREGGGGLWTD
jgi:hypothetical protein